MTCKPLEQSVLNTQRVKEKADAFGVTPLVADWSERDEEIGNLLKSLGTQQLPVIAVFPAENPNQPIVIATGVYTQDQLVNAMDDAGPSKSVGKLRQVSTDSVNE